MEILGIAVTLCVFVVFCISFMPLSTANKAFLHRADSVIYYRRHY